MNLLHLKYAVEVAKTKSINKAAENLYMNQPNLSRAIKELEESLGVEIFKRTTKGITITLEGEEFLSYAEKILNQVDEVESMFKTSKIKAQKFSISVPRASYISIAFSKFAKKIDQSKPIEIFYKETNSMRAINNIIHSDYKLGIIRYQKIYDDQFKLLLDEKDLSSELICEFNYDVIISKNNPLASKTELEYSDLSNFIEVAHADPYVPSMPITEIKKTEYLDLIDKRIYVFERASQFDILEHVDNTFMWVSPVPQSTLHKYNLIQLPCKSDKRVYKDVLIYRNNYKFTELDEIFITEICMEKRKFHN